MDTVKTCKVHGDTDFAYHKDKNLGGRWRCKQCQADYTRQNLKRVRDEAARIKLERGCESCGYNRFAPALHFAHRDARTKEFEPAACRSVAKLMKEIEKCDVLCAVCHVELDLGYTSSS